MSRLIRWMTGMALVTAAGILGYQTPASDRDALTVPPEDAMIETLEWVIPEDQTPPILFPKEGSGQPFAGAILL